MNLVLDKRESSTADDVPADIVLPEDAKRPCPKRRPTEPTTIALVIIAVGVVLYGLYSARAVMFPIALAVFVALPLRPLMRAMSAVRIPKFLAAGILVGACLAIILAGIVWLSAPASKWVDDAPKKLRRAEVKLRALSAPLKEFNEATEQVEAITESQSSSGAVKVEVQQSRLSSTVISATGDFAIGGLIAVSLAFLLLVFGDDLLSSIVRVLPTRRDRRHLEQICFDAEKTVSQYLLTYTAINIGLGTAIGTGLWLIGMPNPVLWGVMAAALNYIPFVGLIAGTLIVSLVAILSFDSTAYAALAPAIYLTANGIEANLITPMLLGRAMKLNTIMIFVAVVVWGWMWGIGGAIIAVPALAVAKIVCDRSPRLSTISAILSG